MSLLDLIPGKATLYAILAAALFGGGFWAGIEAHSGIVAKQEKRAYQEQIERERAQSQKELDALNTKLLKLTEIHKKAVTPAEVNTHVQNSNACVLPDALGLRLDQAAGVPPDVTDAARTAARAKVDLELSFRRLVNALAGRSTELAECRAAYEAARAAQ